MPQSERTNSDLRAAVLKKLGSSPQALSQRAKRLKRSCPMSTAEAVYVIAHQEGIDISRYLPRETVAVVRELVGKLTPSAGAPGGRAGAAGRAAKVVERKLSISLPGSEVVEHPFVADAVAAHCKRMADLYPYVYLFENSVRGLIREVMRKEFGEDWWEKAVPRRVRDKVAGRRKKHDSNAWHSATSADPLCYADIEDLTAIIDANSKQFAPLFKGIADGYRWLTSKLNHIELHRNVAAHSNPLDKENAEEMKRYYKQWQRQAKKIREELAARCEQGSGC